MKDSQTRAERRCRLGVNVDHVATLRQQRGTLYPEPLLAAGAAELAGADQITVHLREDRRHIQDRDVSMLRQMVQTKLNLEMAATQEMIAIALHIQPDMVTLVPERREERTTEGGLNASGEEEWLTETVSELKSGDILVSLFVDPDEEQIEASKRTNADIVELHTGDYCDAETEYEREIELERVLEASHLAESLGLSVAAGHGLDYHNVLPIASIDVIEELNIGHSIISRAVLVGIEKAVREMISLMASARG